MVPAVKVAYIVSRFPLPTETFVLREFTRVDRRPGHSVDLYSLFAGDEGVVHPDARPWLARRRRASLGGAAAALVAWTLSSPRVVASILAGIVRDHAASPRMLGKALVTSLLAMQHARRIRRERTDHVHAHFATYPALAALVVHRLTGIPYTVTPHAHDIFVDQTGLAARLREAAGVVAVSSYNWMFLQHFGARPGRLHRIGYGLDLSRYAYRPRPIPADGRVDVLVISSFRPYKGQLDLLAALALGGAALERLHVEFIGDGELRAEAQAAARRLGLDARCTFSGPRDADHVLGRLGEAHLLVQPSLVERGGDTEGLPNTLIEAAATGLTAVGTRVTGVPELIEDGVSGFLADPESPDDLAGTLVRALGTADLRPLQDEARRRVEERHDIDVVTERLAAMFAQAATA
jgi:glycosyltransferase involved in cell wall biosynthesis